MTPPPPPPRPKFTISPPLLNSACPWATTFKDLKSLYENPYTGAVTTRTSLLDGFHHDPAVHQHAFFRAGGSKEAGEMFTGVGEAQSITVDLNDTGEEVVNAEKLDGDLVREGNGHGHKGESGLSSLNTYGYSPIPLRTYLDMVPRIVAAEGFGAEDVCKPFIFSVTGSSADVVGAYGLVVERRLNDEPMLGGGGGGSLDYAIEINLSCPNIHGRPPPAYERAGLMEYLVAVAGVRKEVLSRGQGRRVPFVGVKLPPYTYRGQFEMVVDVLKEVCVDDEEDGGRSVIDFVTCTNTLGSSLVLDAAGQGPLLGSENGLGLGGLAGAALHPLALGNVSLFRKLLDEHPQTRDVMVIGVGGVEDRDGFERMRRVGAGAVGCASALGRYGVDVFEKITKGT